MKINKSKQDDIKHKEKKGGMRLPTFIPQHLVRVLADEVAKTIVKRLPKVLPRVRRKTRSRPFKTLEKGIFLDTSAIIDGRIFDVLSLGLLRDPIVVPSNILMELKHIADSQDTVRRERGQKGLEMLAKIKKTKGIKVVILENTPDIGKKTDVDESLIHVTKMYKGRIITCDYNLEKKASIQGVTAVNVNALANSLKVTAVPGEALHIKLQHAGKEANQGVGYLDDGTMVVVEQGAPYLEKTIDVVVARVIQTSAGRILFAKKI